ncbi:MAG: DUF2294 family protein [Actinobacteria bacterium]|nr:MAG: DUF2294 family protein [Actinomycetota bacterium]
MYAGDVHRRAFSVMSGAVPFRARNGRIGMAPSQDPTPSEAIETLALELLAILEESYGRTAEKATVHMVDDAVVVFLDGLSFHPSERFLIEKGEGEMVLRTRSAYEDAIQATFQAAVERATGRRVTSFASATKLDPPYSVEVFRLAPEL